MIVSKIKRIKIAKSIMILMFFLFTSINVNSYCNLKINDSKEENIFYPASLNECVEIHVFYANKLKPEEVYLLQTISGLLARKSPNIFIHDEKNNQEFWLNYYKNKFNIRLIYELQGKDGLYTMIKDNISKFKGIIVYDFNDLDSLQIATSLCALNNSIGVASSILDEFRYSFPEYNIIEDARNKKFSSYINFFFKDCSMNRNMIVYQDPTKYRFLTEYAIMNKIFTFSGNLHSKDSNLVFSYLNKNAALLGWGNEEDLVLITSKKGIVVHAADYLDNSHISTGLRLKSRVNMELIKIWLNWIIMNSKTIRSTL